MKKIIMHADWFKNMFLFETEIHVEKILVLPLVFL